MLSRDPTPEEFQLMASRGHTMRYFPEHAYLSGGSGHWRRNGDNYTFVAAPPDYYIRCGNITGTQTDGTMWTRSHYNDASARAFLERQPREHFLENGEVNPSVPPRPYQYRVKFYATTFIGFVKTRYTLWTDRENLPEILDTLVNPSNYDLKLIPWTFRDPSIRNSIELLLSSDGFLGKQLTVHHGT